MVVCLVWLVLGSSFGWNDSLFIIFLFLLKIFLRVLRHLKTHAPELRRAVLVVDCAQLGVFGHVEVQNFFYEVLCTRAQFWFLHMRAFLHTFGPYIFVPAHLAGKIKCTGSQHGRRVLDHGVWWQASFHHVLGKPHLGLRGLSQVAESLKEPVWAGDVHFKVKTRQNMLFHLQNLAGLVGVVSYIDYICDYGWVDFLVFAGNKQASDTNQLEFASV